MAAGRGEAQPPLARPVIATHCDENLAAALRDHPSAPTVIVLPPGIRPWELPAETQILVTVPAGWRKAPDGKPAGWPAGLRWMQIASAGVDAFPRWALEACAVTSARGTNAPAIAEYVLTAILMREKRLEAMAVRGPSDWRSLPVGSVEGKALGIAGFGAIGAAVARLAGAFGMRVRGFRRGGWEGVSGVEPVATIGELFAQSDHLVLAMPATPQTRHIVGPGVLARARPGLHLINVARGSLVDQDALLAALDSGQVGAATLDVTSPEPLPEGHGLYAHPRVRLTPHVAWKGTGNDARFAALLGRNLDAFLAGRPLENLVDASRLY